MNDIKNNLPPWVLAIALVTLLLTPGVAEAASMYGDLWSGCICPHSGSSSSILNAVAALTPNDVWAVGSTPSSSGVAQTLTEHWNGTHWGIAPSPNVGSGNNSLNAVAALTTNDVWAVGSTLSSSGVAQTLTEHWNGTGWSIIASPSAPSGSSFLVGVAALTTNDVWDVGYSLTKSNVQQTLTEHWNGSRWSIIPSPNVGLGNNTLFGVATIATNDVWAAGSSSSSARSNVQQTLTEHWNGSRWSIIPSPNVGSDDNTLVRVTTLTTNDVWAVGYSLTNSGGEGQTLTEHWNGRRWSIIASPNTGSGPNFLVGVAALTTNEVWAVGYSSTSTGTGQTLTEHWNGRRWSIIASPNTGSDPNFLVGVAALTTNDVWVVGASFISSGGEQTLTEHWNGRRWSIVPRP